MHRPLSYRREVIRKAVHMLLSLSVFSLEIWEPRPIKVLFVFLTCVYLLIDFLRLKIVPLGVFFKKMFGIMVRHEEAYRLTGASYAFIGASITIMLFDTVTAISAILIVGLSDAMAAIVGRGFGHTRIGRKSLEGSSAFFLVTFLILFVYTGTDPVISLGISLFCTVLELLLPDYLNDNLVIPVIAGLLITIL